MSRYLTDLNAVSPTEPAPSADFDDEFFQAFANDFVDLDQVNDPFTGLPTTDFDPQTAAPGNTTNTITFEPKQSSSDFLTGDFNFSDFPAYPPVVGGGTDFQAQPNPYPIAAQPQYPAPVSTGSAQASSGTRLGEKRKLSDSADPQIVAEESARVAAEEDKRRRNTAASARFRIKKKQREQALEKTAKEMTEKASTLETKVQQLEMENKWLKSLITEKNDGKNDLQELYDKFTKDNLIASSETTSRESRTDGVGTTKKKTKVEKA